MTNQEFFDQCITGYLNILKAGLPVAAFISVCNICFNIIITAFTSGKLRIGRGGE